MSKSLFSKWFGNAVYHVGKSIVQNADWETMSAKREGRRCSHCSQRSCNNYMEGRRRTVEIMEFLSLVPRL